jgi:hypothetical protein
MVAAVDPLDPRRPIAERPIDAGLPQIGRFEYVRVRRENQGQHRHLPFSPDREQQLWQPAHRRQGERYPAAVKVCLVVTRTAGNRRKCDGLTESRSPRAAREVGIVTLKAKSQPQREITGKYAIDWRKVGGKWMLATNIWNTNKSKFSGTV